MQLFYTNQIENGQALLTREEARHCTRVLRKKAGDPIQMVDGAGGFYHGIIRNTGKEECLVDIERTELEYGRRPFRLHIAIAPTKNISRIEWFLEKATEVGIDEISLILCSHSERRKVRMDRLEKILISAMKQSGKAYLPAINPLTPFSEHVNNQESADDLKAIAYCDESVKIHLKENYQAGQSVSILIGPEGGFSGGEVQQARGAGFLPVKLGPSRFRTETAGLIACHTINLMNE